ncbi:MAG: hypothetical protein Q7T44_04125 [Parvibaculum sp.]|nr:hypothetical protein [Parvibaculum sp.]
MMQKFLFAVAVSLAALVGVSQISVASAAEGDPVTAEQAAFDAKIGAIETLVLQYKDDPAGLQAAIEQYVATSEDPEAAGNAVLFVFDNSNNPEVRALLAANADLRAAMGQGLGAAIAIIALTNPDLATKMTANVVASGNAELIASVQSGTDIKTASLNEQNDTGDDDADNEDSTPENPASAS